MTFPDPAPFDSGFLSTGDGHEVYWEVCGSPRGKPAVVLHGGPGSGATPYWRRFFDPDRYQVLLVDQRGCGRSTPHAGDDVAALEHNTTDHLIADLEELRRHLGIDRWLLFGASWGSTLGLSYAVTHPSRVSELVLWGVVLTRASDVRWATYTMGEVYPEEFDRLLASVPDLRHGENVALAVNRLLRSQDPQVHHAAARAWCAWEDRLGTLSGPVRHDPRYDDPRFRLGFSRLVTHYWGHHAFQAEDRVTGELHRLAGTPAYLLRGRLDIASPLRAAYDVFRGLPGSRLDVVETDAHGAGDDTRQRLIAVLDEFSR